MLSECHSMCSFAWHSFWKAVFGEKGRKVFFYSLLVSFSSFFFSTGKKNIWVIGFNIYERITVSKNCKDAHLHWSFVVSVCFVDLYGEKLSKIGSSWDYIALFKPRVTTVSLPYSLQLCNKFRCVFESNFMSIYWTTHQRDRQPLSSSRSKINKMTCGVLVWSLNILKGHWSTSRRSLLTFSIRKRKKMHYLQTEGLAVTSCVTSAQQFALNFWSK